MDVDGGVAPEVWPAAVGVLSPVVMYSIVSLAPCFELEQVCFV